MKKTETKDQVELRDLIEELVVKAAFASGDTVYQKQKYFDFCDVLDKIQSRLVKHGLLVRRVGKGKKRDEKLARNFSLSMASDPWNLKK